MIHSPAVGRACLMTALALISGNVLQAEPHYATSTGGMVATVNPLATEIGVQVLRDGGNAVDAAVAAALALGVVDGHNSGLGGGCFLLIHRANGEVVAIDGREMAPAQAHRDMYLKDGKAQAEASRTGPLAVATPGALAAYALAVERFGRKNLSSLIAPAARVAESGFVIDRVYADKLASTAALLRQNAGARQLLLKPDGSTYQAGETLRLLDLARTYQQIGERGPDWFYRGAFAERVGAWMGENGGLLAASDFSAYQPKLRTPLEIQYRDYKLVGFPPPSSGGVHVAQILGILENFNLRELYQQDPALFVHVVAEAMKLAFADRAYWLGDPDFAKVPRNLSSAEYCKELAQRIQLDRATPVDGHGWPPEHETDIFRSHTTHFVAADQEGTWASVTATVNTTFGSKVVVPGTGLVLNNEMDDFSIQPGVPNAFGLVGAEANAVAPGKRPLSSMSPTIVFRDGRPVAAVGAAGGPTIISQVVLALIRYIDLGMPIQEAVAAPRFHHQWSPNQITIEKSWPDEVVRGLEQRGHQLRQVATIGVTQAVAYNLERREFVGVHDPRVPGKASGPSP